MKIKNLEDLKILLDLIGAKYEISQEKEEKIIYTNKGGIRICAEEISLDELYLLLRLLTNDGYLTRCEKLEDGIEVEANSMSIVF